MSYKTAIDRLQDAGLFVEFEEPEYIQRRLFNLLDGKEVTFVRYCRIHNVSPILKDKITPDYYENVIKEPIIGVLLLLTERMWRASVMEGHGGILENDFVCKYVHFDEVEQMAIRYYFGSPTVIHDWVVPLHKHPELNVSRVEDAVRQATTLSTQEFNKLRRQLRQAVKEKQLEDEWEITLEQDFIYIPHKVNTDMVCALRRNGLQACIISKRLVF